MIFHPSRVSSIPSNIQILHYRKLTTSKYPSFPWIHFSKSCVQIANLGWDQHIFAMIRNGVYIHMPTPRIIPRDDPIVTEPYSLKDDLSKKEDEPKEQKIHEPKPQLRIIDFLDRKIKQVFPTKEGSKDKARKRKKQRKVANEHDSRLII